jgi:lauroyl/myristoyl acyltransferase
MQIIAFRLVRLAALWLPGWLAEALCRLGAWCAVYVACRARGTLEANLRGVHGEGAPLTLTRRQTRQVFLAFARFLKEFFASSPATPVLLREKVRLEGAEHLDAALASGHGALLVSAHYSNWELGAWTVARNQDQPLLILTQPHAQAAVNDFINGLRERQGVRAVHGASGTREVLRTLRGGGHVAMLADRRTGGPEVRVQLCGRETRLPQGPWRLALATGAAVLPIFVTRHPEGCFTVRISPALARPENGSREVRQAALAQAWADGFEAVLREDPTQWTAFVPQWPELVGQASRAQTVTSAAAGTPAPVEGAS